MTLHLIAQEVDDLASGLHGMTTPDLFDTRIRLLQLQVELPATDSDAQLLGAIRLRISRVLSAVNLRLSAEPVHALPTQSRSQRQATVAALFPSQRVSSDQVARQDADINRMRKEAAIDRIVATLTSA